MKNANKCRESKTKGKEIFNGWLENDRNKRKKACFSWYPSMDIGVLPSCVGYVVEIYITYNNRIYSICNIKYILYTVYIERRIKDVFDKEF